MHTSPRVVTSTVKVFSTVDLQTDRQTDKFVIVIIVVVVVIIILWHSRDAYVSQSSDFSTVKVFYICKFIKLLLRLAAFYVVGCSTSILMFYQLFTVHTKCCRFCVTP